MKYYLKTSLVIILLILLRLTSYSQIKSPTYKIEAIFPEIYIFNDDKFNQFLVENNLPKFNHSNASLGFNFSAIVKNFTISVLATGHNVVKYDKSNDTTLISGIGTYSFRAGYQLNLKKKIIIEPFLGLRTYHYNYTLEVKEDISMEDYVVNGSSSKEISYVQDYIEIGASIDYGKRWTIGISSGFLIPIGEGKWTVDNSKITNDFDIDFNSFIILKAGRRFSLSFK